MDTTARGDKKKLRACSPVWGGKQRARTPLSSTLPCPSQVKASWPRTAPASWERGGHGKSCLEQSPTTSVPPRSSTGVVQAQLGGPGWQGMGQECCSARRGAEPGIHGHGRCVWAWRVGREESSLGLPEGSGPELSFKRT